MTNLPFITLTAIDNQRVTGWPDFHPEDYCHRCGVRNISWSIDSDRFNLAMGGSPYVHRWNGIICISCFVELYEAATGLSCSWTLVPATPFRPIEKEESRPTPLELFQDDVRAANKEKS